MKTMKSWIGFCAALVVLFSAHAAFAATNVSGTWTGDVSMGDGNSFSLTFVLKQDGDKLTGTVQGPQGDPLAIDDGKVDGDKVTFTVTFNGMTIHHEATVTGDEMKMNTKPDSGDMPPMQYTLKRSADADSAGK